MRFVPWSVRKLLERGITACPPAAVDVIMSAFNRVLPARAGLRHPGDKLHKIGSLISASDRDEVYQRLISVWPAHEEVLQSGFDPGSEGARQQAQLPNFTDQMMLLDGTTYLPDDILVKLDRASMANSLEARAPFLDHRIIEFAWQLPLGFKVRNRRGKYVLRQVLYRHVPPPLVDRPKTGFAIPLDSWIRGPLRDWAENLLSERRLRQDGFFRAAPIRRKWCEHLSGTRNWIAPLWTVLMFQAWQEQRSAVEKAEADREMRVVAGI
jgi:asparagine synthase (glutamine-hydrolysing)